LIGVAGEGGKVLKTLIVAAVTALLAGCDKQPMPVATCRAPDLIELAPLKGYAGQRERANHCVKQAAFELTRSGGAVEKAAVDALARCAPEEAAVVAALAKEGEGWSYQRTQIHADLAHLASLTAIQARAIGCGLRPGEEPGTLLESGSR
jgi:uncharacterized membrane protein